MKRAKLKNHSKKKKIFPKKIFKLLIFIFAIYLSYSFTFNFLSKKDIDIKDKKYVDYLLSAAYKKDNKKILLEESLKMVSNIDLKDPATLLPSNIKSSKSETKNKYTKDAEAKEDDYNASVYEKITSYVENPLKDKENPVIYLYNTHQLETYSNSGFENSNVNPNVLMASYLLAESLNKSNINTIVEDTNINEFNRVSGISDNDFYNTTRIFLKEKINKYQSIKYYIDMHRDSVDKNISTCTINNKNYARVLFVLGTKNENYLENKKNMTELDTLMDKYYPGLSRGIYERKAYYNQDLNKNIMLIELGAKENTIEEVTNTIEALTFIFNKYINGDDK